MDDRNSDIAMRFAVQVFSKWIEQIRKMYEQQEEYLVVVKYDVKLFLDLVHLKFRLQRVDEELCKAQKEMYRERASQKKSCKAFGRLLWEAESRRILSYISLKVSEEF